MAELVETSFITRIDLSTTWVGSRKRIRWGPDPPCEWAIIRGKDMPVIRGKDMPVHA